MEFKRFALAMVGHFLASLLYVLRRLRLIEELRFRNFCKSGVDGTRDVLPRRQFYPRPTQTIPPISTVTCDLQKWWTLRCRICNWHLCRYVRCLRVAQVRFNSSERTLGNTILTLTLRSDQKTPYCFLTTHAMITRTDTGYPGISNHGIVHLFFDATTTCLSIGDGKKAQKFEKMSYSQSISSSLSSITASIVHCGDHFSLFSECTRRFP
ncbi:hypothetical protein CEXT_718091 [Caerostris extrusa]|uniref:Secreted protein n=1 Tax=Caerostris extrusa TaxID=172846 RepID=A0AAV4XQP7_CAEEX|nr:hypothetical protein CEXT_718091 [Caerostris extrusa]